MLISAASSVGPQQERTSPRAMAAYLSRTVARSVSAFMGLGSGIVLANFFRPHHPPVFDASLRSTIENLSPSIEGDSEVAP
jgi:ABC-type transporter Mla maintaining outer membrane lipid asymmetry permease subunit MlaE